MELVQFTHLAVLSVFVLLFSRHLERLLRLDFLSVVKVFPGFSETIEQFREWKRPPPRIP